MREEQPKHTVPAEDSHRQIGGGVLPAAIAGSVLFSAAMATPALAEETTAAEQETNPPVATTAQAPVTAEQTQRQAQRSYDDAAKAALAAAEDVLKGAERGLEGAKAAKAEADEALSQAEFGLEAAKARAEAAQRVADEAKAKASARADALRPLTDARATYEAARRAAVKADDAATAAQATADALRPRAEGLAGRQEGLDEAARVAQAKADVRRVIADELAKLPSDDALVANPATVGFVIKWLDAYKTDDADVAAAVRDYASRLHAARRSAAHGLAMQGRVDADEKVANEARSKADEAKATLDEANRQLAIKQAIDRAMGETDANADQSASDGAATPRRATAGTYVPKHCAKAHVGPA